MGQTKEQRIVAVGVRSLGPGAPAEARLLVEAVGAMIAEATKAPEKRAKPTEGRKDYSVGYNVLEALQRWAPRAVAWSPTEARTLVLLGKAYRDAQASSEDLTALGQWLANGALDWMKEQPATSYIARHFVDLVAKARVWSKGNRPKESALDKVRDR